MHENDENKWKAEGCGGQLFALLVDAISISNQMAKHRSAVSVFCRFQNVGSACNAGGSSSLCTRMNAAARLMQPAAMRSNAPQNHLPFPAARVKHTAHASTGTTSAAHSTARAPLMPHLHQFAHATPRHTLHHQQKPSSTSCRSCAYWQVQWLVAGT